MDTTEVLAIAHEKLKDLAGYEFDVLSLGRPKSIDAALSVIKIISKLSPLIGNLIEFNIVDYLNEQKVFRGHGHWLRQDPGFPDAIFEGSVDPVPGLEIKAWYPMATEITARFKDSQSRFTEGNTDVAIMSWVPTHLLYGQPCLLDTCILSGLSVAQARDNHYYNPPDYLVIEPGDTTSRTRNLQQTNTAGYKFQGTKAEFQSALAIVEDWGPESRVYNTSAACQERINHLIGNYRYRLDTNFAKMDRIGHEGLEIFKSQVLAKSVHGMTIRDWSRLFASNRNESIVAALGEKLGLTEGLSA